MDPLSTLLSWQFVLLCLAVSAIIFVFRTVVDFTIKSLGKTSSLWEDVILPSSPVILGGLMGWFMDSFPYPDNLTSKDFRIIFGLVAGFLSASVYRMIKATIIRKVIDAIGDKKIEDGDK